MLAKRLVHRRGNAAFQDFPRTSCSPLAFRGLDERFVGHIRRIGCREQCIVVSDSRHRIDDPDHTCVAQAVQLSWFSFQR